MQQQLQDVSSNKLWCQDQINQTRDLPLSQSPVAVEDLYPANGVFLGVSCFRKDYTGKNIDGHFFPPRPSPPPSFITKELSIFAKW